MSAWLRQHAQALAAALARLVGQPFASGLSVLVLAVAIALPVVAAVALRSLGAAAASLDTDPHVNVFLGLEAGDDEVKRVGAALRADPDAAAVRFVPRAEALAELRDTTHLAEILATLERNPLPHAYTVRLRSASPATLARLRADWARLPGVDQVQADFEWTARLARWVRLGERLVTAGWVLLGSAVAFIVGHLIRLQVVTRRDEIEVSQLIGATAPDVRRPFLYHGAAQGLAAGGLALALAAALGFWAEAELQALTPGYASDFKIVFLDFRTMAAVALASAALGLGGAWIAVDRELRRFSAER